MHILLMLTWPIRCKINQIYPTRLETWWFRGQLILGEKRGPWIAQIAQFELTQSDLCTNFAQNRMKLFPLSRNQNPTRHDPLPSAFIQQPTPPPVLQAAIYHPRLRSPSELSTVRPPLLSKHSPSKDPPTLNPDHISDGEGKYQSCLPSSQH